MQIIYLFLHKTISSGEPVASLGGLGLGGDHSPSRENPSIGTLIQRPPPTRNTCSCQQQQEEKTTTTTTCVSGGAQQALAVCLLHIVRMPQGLSASAGVVRQPARKSFAWGVMYDGRRFAPAWLKSSVGTGMISVRMRPHEAVLCQQVTH